MRWVKIFKTIEAAETAIEEGKARRLVIGELLIAIVRADNAFYAIDDSCPHNGASLSKGWVNSSGDIICPLHNYCYSLANGREFNQLTPDAKTYPIKIEDDSIFLGLT